jgi:hypothetical protein
MKLTAKEDYFYVDNKQTPVSDPELALAFQAKLLALVHGEDMAWPVYGRDKHMYNITGGGFEATTMPPELRERCGMLNRFVFDPTNGA